MMKTGFDNPTSIETFTGHVVDVTNYEIEDVDFRSIAHSLSMICRFGGHCRQFYSVATHSIHCHQESVMRYPGYSDLHLACLLHDAAEAYWHDLGTPLKAADGMGAYHQYIDQVQDTIYQFVGLDITESLHQKVKEIDIAVLAYEVARLMPSGGEGWGQLLEVTPAQPTQLPTEPAEAEEGFLSLLTQYGLYPACELLVRA